MTEVQVNNISSSNGNTKDTSSSGSSADMTADGSSKNMDPSTTFSVTGMEQFDEMAPRSSKLRQSVQEFDNIMESGFLHPDSKPDTIREVEVKECCIIL